MVLTQHYNFHRVLVNPPHPPIKYNLVFKYIFVLKYITTQTLELIYDQRTTSNAINILLVHKPLYNNTVNMLLVHVTSKIYHVDALIYPCIFLMSVNYQRRHHLGIYKSLYFPKPKLSACTLNFLTAACWHQWWLRRRLIPIKS